MNEGRSGSRDGVVALGVNLMDANPMQSRHTASSSFLRPPQLSQVSGHEHLAGVVSHLAEQLDVLETLGAQFTDTYELMSSED